MVENNIDPAIVANTFVPPQIITVSGLDDFLENGQPIESQLLDEQIDSVTPLDLLSSKNYTTKEVRDERFEICKTCPEIFKPTKTCKQCGCFMGLKTWLVSARCDLGKW